MHRRIYSIVGFVLLVLLILGLAVGCGETEEPTATSAPHTQKPPEPTVPPTESAEDPRQEVDDRQQSELDSAIEEHSQAIAIDPQDTEAYYHRGLAYVTTGQYDQALADFGKVLELDPANASAYYVCGQVYAELGEREESIAYLERALVLGLSPEMEQYAEEILKELGRE